MTYDQLIEILRVFSDEDFGADGWTDRLDRAAQQARAAVAEYDRCRRSEQ